MDTGSKTRLQEASGTEREVLQGEELEKFVQERGWKEACKRGMQGVAQEVLQGARAMKER